MSFATFHDEQGTFFYVLTVYSNGVYESFKFFFIFLQIIQCHPCTFGGWSSLAICWVCIRLRILWVYGSVASWLLWIVRVIMHLIRKCLFEHLFKLRFIFLWSASLSRFSWSVWWSLSLNVISCTFWDSVLSTFVRPYDMNFCSLSRPELDFSILSCSHLGCVDLCRVILLCVWILCGILSVHQGTIPSLLASSRSLSLFVLFVFSTSLVGRLWICNCLEQFLY